MLTNHSRAHAFWGVAAACAGVGFPRADALTCSRSGVAASDKNDLSCEASAASASLAGVPAALTARFGDPTSGAEPPLPAAAAVCTGVGGAAAEGRRPEDGLLEGAAAEEARRERDAPG